MLALSVSKKIALKAAVLILGFAAVLSANAGQVNISVPIPNNITPLTTDDVNTIIAQGVGYMKGIGVAGIIAVADREGHILAIYRMNTAVSSDPRINEQATVKARTASFFESQGDSFTSRTAQFIVQSNFPPKIRNVDAGPLFGVPFSNQPGADVQLQVPPAIAFVNLLNAPGPLAVPAGTSNMRPLQQPLVITPLTDDPGGMPLFKGKIAVGSVGVEIDGFGVLANGVADAGVGRTDTGIVPGPSKQLIEEAATLACNVGFETPATIKANKVTVNGFRFPFVAARKPKFTPVAVADLATLGKFEPYFDTDGTERDPNGTLAVPAYPPFSTATTQAVTSSAVRATPVQEFPTQGFVGRFPPRDSPLGAITKADVLTMVQQAADEAFLTRGAIRNPKGVSAAVWITVVDLQGNICGLYRTNDATVFSFDLCVQKARTAAFFSTDNVGFSSRAIGFMSQTFFPPGVESHPPGPISGLLENAGGSAGNLGPSPTGTDAGNLTQISQLLTDDNTNTLVPVVLGSPTTGALVRNAVALLSRRLPHIRDGRISPLQVSIYVDLSLRAAYDTGTPQPPTLKMESVSSRVACRFIKTACWWADWASPVTASIKTISFLLTASVASNRRTASVAIRPVTVP